MEVRVFYECERGDSMKSVVSILLVEDDTRTCRELEACLDGESELELLGITSSSIEAFQMVCDMLPDVIILDLELHEGGRKRLVSTQGVTERSCGRTPLCYSYNQQLQCDYI